MFLSFIYYLDDFKTCCQDYAKTYASFTLADALTGVFLKKLKDLLFGWILLVCRFVVIDVYSSLKPDQLFYNFFDKTVMIFFSILKLLKRQKHRRTHVFPTSIINPMQSLDVQVQRKSCYQIELVIVHLLSSTLYSHRKSSEQPIARTLLPRVPDPNDVRYMQVEEEKKYHCKYTGKCDCQFLRS